MKNDQKNPTSNPNRVRNQLVGFATLLLILAAIAPWILTDKSNSRTSTTPILKPDVVSQQNQVTSSTDESNNNFVNNNANSLPDIPYIPNEDQNTDSVISPNIEDVESSTVSGNVQSEPETKLYMIQLTALKNKQKIEELVALLRLNNYNVRIIPKNPEPNQLIKLQVGPYAKKEQAEQVIINLNNLTKLKGIIISN